MNQGFILLHRQLLDWEWYDHIPTKVLFIHCLLRANHSAGRWRGQPYKRGQFITSLNTLVTETGLTSKQVRTAIDNLVESGELGKASTSLNTLISVTNYEKYQSKGTPKDKLKANEGQSKGKRRANEGQQINNEINDNNEINETNNNTGKPKIFNFKNELINLGINEQTAADYIAQRNKKRASNTETALNMLKKEIAKSGKTAQDCIEVAIERGWIGYKHEWDKATTSPQTQSQKVAAHVLVKTNKNIEDGWS